MNIQTNPVSDFHFAAPSIAPPVTMPINAAVRYTPPQIPNVHKSLVNPPSVKLNIPHFNTSNPNRLHINVR